MLTWFQLPYNVERLLFLSSGYNTKLIEAVMTGFEKNGNSKISGNLLDKLQMHVSGKDN